MQASDLMHPGPLTIAPSTPFLQIQHLFVVSQISGAPVVDERGTVVGVIASSDLLRVIDQVCDEEIDPGPDGTDELPERLGALTALDVVTPEVVWVAPDEPISRVAQIMREQGVHRVLVGEQGRLAGILTTFDLLQAVAA